MASRGSASDPMPCGEDSFFLKTDNSQCACQFCNYQEFSERVAESTDFIEQKVTTTDHL